MAKLASARWTRIEKDHFIKEEIYEMAWTKDGRRKDLSKYTIAFSQYGGPIALSPKPSKKAEVTIHSLSGVDIGRLDGIDRPPSLPRASVFRPHRASSRCTLARGGYPAWPCGGCVDDRSRTES